VFSSDGVVVKPFSFFLCEAEDAACRLGYTRMRLETGNEAPEALGLYTSAGYEPIPCWGPFADDPKSRCFEKTL